MMVTINCSPRFGRDEYTGNAETWNLRKMDNANQRTASKIANQEYISSALHTAGAGV